jgi:hypothetical protein
MYTTVKTVKINFTLEKAIQGVEVQIYSLFNLGTRWDGWLKPRPGRFTPEKETHYPLCRKLGGPQGQSGQAWKISPPPGFDPQTVQPIVSCYTNYAIPALSIAVHGKFPKTEQGKTFNMK